MNPRNQSNLYLSQTDQGGAYSIDGGNSFKRSRILPSDWRNTCYKATYDPTIPNLIYSVWASRHDAPYYCNADEKNNKYGGFAVSYNNGVTFNASYSSGLPESCTAVDFDIMVDPSNDENRIVFVACFNHGFYISMDSGKTFAEYNEGINLVYDRIMGYKIKICENTVYAMTAYDQ